MSDYTLKITNSTFLKLKPDAANGLLPTEKFQLEAGKLLPIASWTKHDDIHFRIAFDKDDLGNQIAFPGPEGTLRNTWLVFGGHCQILSIDGIPVRLVPNSVDDSIKLEDFLGTPVKFAMDAIAEEKLLATQIQERLIALGLLDPPADGKFGPVSLAALADFQELTDCNEQGFLGAVTAEKLLNTNYENALNLGNDLASRIIKYMQEKKYYISLGQQRYNIVYVEGMNKDGTLNQDQPNVFNDLRLVIEIINGVPQIVGIWEATTEPGKKYTVKSLSSKGAARIKFGQYKAWQVGFHHRSTEGHNHPALVQAKPVSVHRDLNKDFMRVGDFIETGVFFINQHHGYNYSKNDIQGASAGCLVGRLKEEHFQFMDLIKQDKRYLASKNYLFYSTIIPGDELA